MNLQNLIVKLATSPVDKALVVLDSTIDTLDSTVQTCGVAFPLETKAYDYS